MVPPIHLGAWSMALMLWLPFELLLLSAKWRGMCVVVYLMCELKLALGTEKRDWGIYMTPRLHGKLGIADHIVIVSSL